jgi:hypothetical protein
MADCRRPIATEILAYAVSIRYCGVTIECRLTAIRRIRHWSMRRSDLHASPAGCVEPLACTAIPAANEEFPRG